MKARIIGLMLVAGVLISGNPASAQFKDLLNKGVNSALDKKLKKDEEERKKKEAEKKKAQGQTQSGDQQSSSNPADNLMQKKMMGMMGMKDVKHETSYSFTSSMTMEMQSTDSLGKKSEKVLYTTFFDKNSKSFAMEFEAADKQTKEKQQSLFIYDYKNWAMLILGGKSGEKSGIAMEMPKDSAIEAKQKQGNNAQDKKDYKDYMSSYKPTGRTKTIAGYSCKEYVHENPQGKTEIWATKDVVFDYSSAYGQMGGMGVFASGGTTSGVGTMMEMHTYAKDSKAQSDLTVVDIKPSNPKTFNLAGYQIIGMGGGQGQQPKGKGKK
ncbi:MAG: hypothetical protein EHM93_13395 [Bacteroidales bacterium]|nr:MAG: hypothetical protein EHM93_13395 [Bacteroidales bacterium]